MQKPSSHVYSPRRVLAARLLPLWFAAVAACVAPLAFAEVYRWVDANGQVHYGDRPPASSTQAVKFKPGTTAETARRELDAREAARLQARVSACEAAKSQLQTYNRAVKLVLQDPDGSQRELDAGEREDLIAETSLRVRSTCDEVDSE